MPDAARSAATEATDTIAPRPLASRCGSAERATRNEPVRFTATIAEKSCGDSSATPPGAMTPAFSTSPSSRPNVPLTAPISSSTCPASAMSQTRSRAPVSAATARRAPARRPQIATRQPPAENMRAAAAPMPPPPPVTRTARAELMGAPPARRSSGADGLIAGSRGRAQVSEAGARGLPGPQYPGRRQAEHQQAEREPWRPDRWPGDLVERPVDGARGDQDADDRGDDQPHLAVSATEVPQRADRHQQVDHHEREPAEGRAPGEQREQPRPELVHQQRHDRGSGHEDRRAERRAVPPRRPGQHAGNPAVPGH